MTNLTISEQLKYTTAGIIKNGNYSGSGVLFVIDNTVYCITAAHILYGISFSETCSPAELLVLDHDGKRHNVASIKGDEALSKGYDISVLILKTIPSAGNFIKPYFSTIPTNKSCSLILRGYYGDGKGPVNRTDVFFDEKKTGSSHHFVCDIDKEKLTNHIFQYGDEWLGGSSGSGLFFNHKDYIACAGILLAIPDKGDNGKLIFCSPTAIEDLGVNIPLLASSVFEQDTSKLSQEWFKQKIDESIAALGERYTPKLNFRLPIAKIFNGLSRNEAFKRELNEYFATVFIKRRHCYHVFQQKVITALTVTIEQHLNDLKSQYLELSVAGAANIPFQPLIDLCSCILNDIDTCLMQLYTEGQKMEETKPRSRHASHPFSNEYYELHELSEAISDFRRMLESDTCKLSNHPAIILKGDGGYGKSHLLADVVIKRYEEGKFSLLLLGQHFVTTETPWRQALSNQVRFEGDEHSFLAALNARAELSGSRIIIFIDAINEGRGKEFWGAQLQNFIRSILRYPWLGVVVSVRSSYHTLLVDKKIYDDNLALSITHTGFSDLEYEASDYFFDNYKIKKPGIPFLHPEFRSPLFLKLFCDGLRAKGMDTVPTGYNGITAILEFFLDGINTKLSIEFGYNAAGKLVQKLVYALADHIAGIGTKYLSFEDALHFAEQLPALRIMHNRPQFLEALVHEGVLSKNLYHLDDGTNEEGVYFLYERFFDHLHAKQLLQLVGKNPMRAFANGGSLYRYFRDEATCYDHAGLIEAMSVQIPEKYDLEFFDLVPHVANTRCIAEAFIQSLVWRRNNCFIEKNPVNSWVKRTRINWKSFWTGYPKDSKIERLIQYINQVIVKRHYMLDNFRNHILLVTADPMHYFNADFVHTIYMRQVMAKRDSDLLPWISEQYHNTEGSPVKRLIDWGWKDERRLNITDASIFLSATMMGWFLSSADRKIRDTATKSLITLLQYRPHLLVKLLHKYEGIDDPYIYERLLAVCYGCTLRADNLAFLPELCKYLLSYFFGQENVYPHILARDYARGIIDYANLKEVNLLPEEKVLAYPPYSSQPITNCPTNEEIDQHYKLNHDSSKYAHYQNAILESMTTEYGRGVAHYGDFGRYVFQSSLYDWDVNADELSNYAVKLVFEMGYDVTLHGWFDQYGRQYRDNSSERIGKKYQWIAMMEVLARVSDHAVMYEDGDYKRNKPSLYRGPWQPNVRDIDPTIILPDTQRTDSESWHKDKPWWIDISLIDFEMTNEEWMSKTDNIPTVGRQVIRRDASGQEWLSLELMFDMSEEAKLGEERYNTPCKRIYQQIRAYLVKDNDFEKFKKWGAACNFEGMHMPESPTKRGVFAKEYYWSDAYNYYQQTYQDGNGDEEIYSSRNGNLIATVHVPVEKYSWEKEFDYSKDRPLYFCRPSHRLWQGLSLQFSHREGEYLNLQKEIISMDPSVNAAGPTCLLVRKDAMIAFLNAEGYHLCWTLKGEKQILSSNRTGSPDEPRIEHKFSGFYWLDGDTLTGNIKSKVNRF